MIWYPCRMASGASEIGVATEFPDVELRSLTALDAQVYFAVVVRSRDYLTLFGDYTDLSTLTLADVRADFVAPPEEGVRMGIWNGFGLVGRADLNAVRSGHFVVGYWLGEGQTGRGFATAAVRALIDFGRAVLGATEFWAGVTHGNAASIRVLERLGFEFVERLERHTRFHLAT